MRVEHDSLGSIEVPAHALYGAQTVRAYNNFQIVKDLVHPEMIRSLAYVKKAAALANYDVNAINEEVKTLMVQACDEIINYQHLDQFITTSIQGGAGTSINMNMNEVIANRSAQIKGLPLGAYQIVHPNDHANKGQSTNDVIPTAGKLTSLALLESLYQSLSALINTCETNAQKYETVIKVGRTHLQDAVLISFGQIFNSHASLFKRDLNRIKEASKELLAINLGGTAVGTGINSEKNYAVKAVNYLSLETEYPFYCAKDKIDNTRNLDSFVNLHASLKTAAANLSRVANDFRLMASGPRTGLSEIELPKRQPGSSIMPGKVNPVILEVCNQASFQVIANDTAVTLSSEAGQMELNVFEPVLFRNLFESIEILSNAYQTLNDLALVDLKVNKDVCDDFIEKSFAQATPIINVLGYDTTTNILREAVENNKTLKEIILEKELLSEEEFDKIVDPLGMIGVARE
ncbi:MAG TPA: aspartate ammonia-lyase [Erysipelothrix sp.]